MAISAAIVGALGATGRTNFYRHLRIYVTAITGSSYTAIQEIEIASALGGGDITVPGMATNQSSYYGSNTAAQAIDNNFTDIVSGTWVSAGAALPQWITVDLAAPSYLAELRVWPQAYSDGPNRALKDFRVEGSNDGTNWTLIKAFTGVTGWVNGTSKSFVLL